MFTFLLIAYLVLSVIAAGIVMSACIVSGRAARRNEGKATSTSKSYSPVLVRKAA